MATRSTLRTALVQMRTGRSWTSLLAGLAFGFLVLFVVSGCDSSGPPPSDDVAEIRFENRSGFDFDSLHVAFRVLPGPGQTRTSEELTFGGLPDGASSDYQRFETNSDYNYSIAFGETPLRDYRFGPLLPDGLAAGRYVYRLAYERVPFTALVLRQTTTPEAPSDAVEVRVHNQSSERFDEVIAFFPGSESVSPERVAYGPVKSGAASAYRTVELAYRYVTAQAVIGTDTLEYTAIDYVGEEPLAPGKYTYNLDLSEQIRLEDATELIRE